MELCLGGGGRGEGGEGETCDGVLKTTRNTFIISCLSKQFHSLVSVSLSRGYTSVFFARAGDKIFSHFVASPARDESRVAAALEFLER